MTKQEAIEVLRRLAEHLVDEAAERGDWDDAVEAFFDACAVLDGDEEPVGRHVGYWVVYDEPSESDGFFVGFERARTFHTEPGFGKNHLEPVYIAPQPHEVTP